MTTLVKVMDVEKVYKTGAVIFTALHGVSLDIAAGDFVAVMGPSGSGKSTLLHLLGGLDRPTAGRVEVHGVILSQMDETALAKFRRAHIGFIFQFFNLIDNLTVRANIELPALLQSGRERKVVRRRADALLESLGIVDQANKHPWELSGGQQQRVAIARALINHPMLLLADEPTGNLDSASGQEVLRILREFNAQGQTILMVTHDPAAAAQAQHVIFIRDGRLAAEMPGSDVQQIAQSLAALTGT
ncbi:MAG TPA: ABC transporter ATP-binding protein [Anaerolineae bacterium]|nr:ABC transporter ATP-binding protein [Anaerolineae bacterium]HQH38210.1 ABC transporter ATP-binding protein [Anaerolineae bacterium]